MNTKEQLYLVKNAGIWSEYLGQLTSTGAGAGAGAGIAGLLTLINQGRKGQFNGRDLSHSMLGGGVVGGYGSYLANMLGGPLAGAFTKTRSFDEQKGSEKELMSNLLIPGRSSYNLIKRIGHSARGEGGTGEAAEKEEKEEK